MRKEISRTGRRGGEGRLLAGGAVWGQAGRPFEGTAGQVSGVVIDKPGDVSRDLVMEGLGGQA